MRRRLSRLVFLTAAVVLTACGSKSPTGPTLDPAIVAGIYTPTVLSFDPQGSLPSVNLLDAIGQEVQSFMSVSTNGTFQFLFIDNQTKQFVPANGSYKALENGIRLTFDNASDAERLLLPKQIDLTFDQTAGTLSFTGDIQAPRARLFQLVPEWQNEPLADPVPGTLTVQFTVVTSQ